MRIRQAFVGCKNFRDPFMRKFGFSFYRNKLEPAVFFGLYRSQWKRILEHRAAGIIVWAGGDAWRLPPDFVKTLKSKKGIRHIAISSFIARDLDRYGIEYTRLPITPFTYEGFKAEPLGEKIYIYLPDRDDDQRTFYGGRFLDQIKKRMPGQEFIQAKMGDHTKQQLINLYKDCFLGLRLTPHDGMSNTVVELGLMGRRVVWNGEAPNAIPFTDVDSIIQTIEAEKQRIGQTDSDLAQRMQRFITLPDDWMNVDVNLKYFAMREKIEIPEHRGPEYCTVLINTVNEDPVILRDAIRSYMNQEEVRMQIILSTVEGDPSVEIAKEMGLTLSISPVKGIYEQLNYALQFVEGDWFAYASGNDLAAPTKFRDEIAQCKRENKLICYSDFMRVDGSLNPGRTHHFHPYDIQKHLQGNFVNDCATIHRSILDRFAPFDLKWGNHAYWDLWLRVYEKMGNVFCYNRKVEWFYRVDENSQHIQRKKDPEKKRINEELREKMISHHKAVLKLS